MPKPSPKPSVIVPQSPQNETSEVPTDFESPESSTIAGAIYNPDTETLRVTFRHENAVYVYRGVPVAVWMGFYQAQSRGKFFQSQIRPLYHGERGL